MEKSKLWQCFLLLCRFLKQNILKCCMQTISLNNECICVYTYTVLEIINSTFFSFLWNQKCSLPEESICAKHRFLKI